MKLWVFCLYCWTVFYGWLSPTCSLHQTLCCLCSTTLTAQFIWWPYAVPPQVDKSHLFAAPNTVLSVQYRYYRTIYMVTICSASTGGQVPPVRCTKHCAVCAVPLLQHSLYGDHMQCLHRWIISPKLYFPYKHFYQRSVRSDTVWPVGISKQLPQSSAALQM